MAKYLKYLAGAAIFFASCGQERSSIKDHPAYHNPVTQAFTDSVAAHPEDPRYYYQRAEALTGINQDSLALADVLKAQELDPKNPQYSYTAGYLQLQLGKNDAAVTSLLHNLQQSPGDVRTRLLLSKAYIAAGNIKGAQEQVSTVLVAAPGHTGAMMMQAQVDVARKDTSAAIAIMKDLLTADNRNYDASYLLADWYRASGKPEAIAQYRYTYSLDTMDVSPLFEIGTLYEQRQQWQQAKEAYRVCIIKDRDYTDAYVQTGKILLRQDSLEKALRHFNLAIITMPNSATAYCDKGLCFEKMNQRDSALVAYRQALVFDNGLKEAREGLQRLKK